MKHISSDRNRARFTALAAVVMLAAVCLVPMAASDSDAASVRNYTVNLAKGMEWQTDYTYTETLSPELSVVVSNSQVGANTTGWSTATTGSTPATAGNANSVLISAYLDTTAHKVKATIKVGANYSSANAYVGLKLVTKNPSQSAITAFNVNVLNPSVTGYQDDSYYVGETMSQTPVLNVGNGHSYKSVQYSISNGSNGKSLNQNTGLDFTPATGKISGTVSNSTNTVVTYTVTAKVSFDSGYPGYINVTAQVRIGSYASASASDVSFDAVKGVTDISVAAPSTSGITYSFVSATYKFNNGSQTAVTPGTAFSGIVVNSSGAVSGKATASGTYVISETFNVLETGQQATRTVTVTVEDKVTVSVAQSVVNTYVGGAPAGTSITTASHTETNKVNGSWSIVESNTGFNINPTAGVVTAGSTLTPGVHSLTLKYTSSRISTNSATVSLTVNVDSNLVLSCSDADKVLYAATDSSALDNGQDSATMSQTAALYAGQKKVTYALSSSTLDVSHDVSIGSDGKITISGTLDPAKVGTHKVTVTCTDSAVTANQATMEITVTIVAAMSTGAPSVGTITSS